MIYEPETVKGFQDFLPSISQKREKVKEIIRKNFLKYGFQPVETPIVEFDELMKGDTLDQEDEAVSDRFRLQDRGGRKLGLRYEFTFQLSRIFKQNPNLKLPFKRYQLGPVFRDEPTSANRFRQFTQCDADIIGDPSINADAECVALFSDIFKELKIKINIEVNNRKLLNEILDSVQIKDKARAMRELDKLEKIGEDAVKTNLRKVADTNQILTLFKMLEKDLSFYKKNAFEGANEILKLQELGKAYGFKIKFNPFMIRGLGYYTGNIFEFKSPEKKDTLAAGGRYNKVVGKYMNKEIPAVGISFGLERITELAQIKIDNTKTILISLNQDQTTIKLAQTLRKNNISCSTFFGKPGKALDFANSNNIQNAIFIGAEEIASKKFKLKNMQTGDEKLLSEKQILNKLN